MKQPCIDGGASISAGVISQFVIISDVWCAGLWEGGAKPLATCAQLSFLPFLQINWFGYNNRKLSRVDAV
jgi:hypothetical protein